MKYNVVSNSAELDETLRKLNKRKLISEGIYLVVFVIGILLSSFDLKTETSVSTVEENIFLDPQLWIGIITILSAIMIIMGSIYFRIKRKIIISRHNNKLK